MKTLTIVQAFSKVRRDVMVDGIDPIARVVLVWFGGCAGRFRFCYQSGQGVEPEVENWVLADLQAVREHVRTLGHNPGSIYEPSFREQPKREKKPKPEPVDKRQVELFGASPEAIAKKNEAAERRVAQGARRTDHRFRLGGGQ